MSRRVAGSRRKDDPRGPAPAVQDAGEPDLVVVGRVGRPQGIKGEVTVEVRTDDPDERFAPGATLITEQGPLTVAQSRDHSGRLVVLFEGLTDRNSAELLRDRLLQVDARTLPPLEDDDEFYDAELVGMAAVTVDGDDLGAVKEVLHLPHGDVLVLAGGVREHLVPFVRAMVPDVDRATRRLLVDPPPGLLDLSAPPEAGAHDEARDEAHDGTDSRTGA